MAHLDPLGFALFMLLGALVLGLAELYDHARRNW
jgi:hypothetical protein